jgi:hypothetical protein
MTLREDFWSAFLCCAALACAASCTSDGDGGGGSTTQSAGVDEAKPAPELTATEAENLCKAGTAKLTRAVSCPADAAMRTEDPASCERVRDDCLALERTDDCEGAMVQADLAECDGVTAGDIGSCIDEIVAWMKTISCEDAGNVGAPPDCAIELDTSCPGIFSDEDMGSTGEPGGTGGAGGSSGTGASGGGGSSEPLECPEVAPSCVEAYASFCECCGRSEGCVASEDPCGRAAGLEAECDADATCEPGCANWIIGNCDEFRAAMGEMCMF